MKKRCCYGRCVEKGCPWPALLGALFCRMHWRMFEGDWPTKSHDERNVTASPARRKGGGERRAEGRLAW